MPARRILHVDVDAMFVQCAVLADPERLAGERLILVGGTPEGRGVVTSASYGCREFGVRSAMSTAKALRLCPQAVVVRVPGEMIRRKSRELAASLEQWTPVAAMASVDEAYLDLSGTESLYDEDLEATARRIQRDIKEKTALDVSIGGGTNRLVAKLATNFIKPNGVCVVPPGGEEDFVGRLDISDLIGVGPSLQDSLRRHGIVSMSGLRALDVETMASWWGEDRARWLWRRCRGIDEGRIHAGEIARSISSQRTLPRDLTAMRSLERALLGEVVDVAASLRGRGLFARTITVKVRDRGFHDHSRSRTLTEAVQTDRVIYGVARQLLRELRERQDEPVRLVGVCVSNLLDTGEPVQASLTEIAPPLEGERERRLAGAVDKIRRKYGRVVGPGSVIAKEDESPGERGGRSR